MYYPEQRFVTKLMTIRRQVMLPDEAIGSVRIEEGKRVDIRDVVAQGIIPARHVILEGAAFFGLKNPDNLSALMLVKERDIVDVRQPIAGKARDRGRRLFSPVRGIVAQIAHGRVIIQEMPELIDLEAGVQGRISDLVPGRGVIIETVGSLIQGVWGNNKRVLAVLRMEPEEGLEGIMVDQLEKQYSGSVVVTKRQLRATGLMVMADQGFSGIVAPSMDAELREQAMKADGAIMLTEGFGNARMSNLIQTTLAELEGRQVTLDAYLPNRFDSRRPEIIVNQRAEQRPPTPNLMLTLRPGMNVRVTRAPHTGIPGKVVDLPKTPTLLDNGLRVACAQVELITGDTVFVPLANLEYYGR